MSRFATSPNGPGQWTMVATPADNVVATVTKAGVPGFRHICQGFTFSVVANSAAAADAATRLVALVDGVTTILGFSVSVNVSGQYAMALSGLFIPAAVGADLSFGFSSASGANKRQAVTLIGITLPDD